MLILTHSYFSLIVLLVGDGEQMNTFIYLVFGFGVTPGDALCSGISPSNAHRTIC